MRSILAVAIAMFALSCSESSKGTSDAGDCDCHVEGSGFDAVLVMSWSCYCAAYGDGCTRNLAAACNEFHQRLDYPGCGMTVLRVTPAGGPIDDVFDADGRLVGARIASDTGTYACPSDPAITALKAQSGQLPAATCREVACGACSASPTSCAAADGSAGQ
jgi:hypothetical protein